MSTRAPARHPLVYVVPNADTLLEQCRSRLERLRTEGFAVCVAAPHSAGLDEFAREGFETRPLPGKDRWNIPGRLGAYPILQAQFLEDRPTLVHGIGAPWAWLAAYAAHRAAVPATLATVERHEFGPVHLGAYRRLASWVDRYLVHHEADLEALLSRDIVSSSKIELLLGGRGIDVAAFKADQVEPAPRPTGRVVIATRTGPHLRPLQQSVARRHPSVGWIDSPLPMSAPLLAAADIFLSADETDVTGVDLMAAAAMGIPVISVPSPAARSVVVDFETGRIAGSAVQLSTLVDEVVGDPKRRADMGIRARARAEQRFDRHQIDEQLLRIYDRLLTPMP